MVLILAATLGLVLVALGIGVVVRELAFPDLDSAPVVVALGNVITILVGATVGYLAGSRRG